MSDKKSKKRRAEVSTSDSDVSGPRSPKKNNSIRNLSFADDSVFDHDHDLDDAEAVVDRDIDPITMLDCVEKFNKYLKDNGHDNATVSTVSKYAHEFLLFEELSIEPEIFIKSFKKVLMSSLRLNMLTISGAISHITPYLERGEAVQLFSDFPARPPPLNIYYAKKTGMKMGVGKTADIKTALSSDIAGRHVAETELGELEVQFLKDLEAFESAHRDDLKDSHRKFLENKIKQLRKKVLPTDRVLNGTPRGTLKKKKGVTAFSLFCSTKEKEDKYKVMDPERRERKLQKKFDKMEPSQKEIYEKIARSQ